MKKILTLFRSALMTAALMTAVSYLNAAVVLSENFDALTAGNLIGQSSWVAKTANHTDNPIQVASPSLSYAGYSAATTGNSVRLYTTTTTGEDGRFDLTAPQVVADGQSLYIAMLVRPNVVAYAEGKSRMTAFFTGLSGSTGGSEMVFLHAIPGTEAGKVKFSVGRSEANTNYANQAITTEEYDINAVYLVVLKYTAVAGTANDELSLYVNPALTAEPTTAAATYTGSAGSDLGANGLKGIQLKQHSTFNSSCADVTVDAIKVCTAWADLAEAGSEPEEPVVTTAITTDPTSITIANPIFSNVAEHKETISVTATNLTADVTISVTGADAAKVSVSPATISMAQLADGAAVNVEVTIQPQVSTGAQVADIEFATTGLAANHKVNLAWTVQKVYNNIADFCAESAEGAYGYVAGEIVITAVESSEFFTYVYIQDDSKALKAELFVDEDESAAFVEGAHITMAYLSASEGEYYLTAGNVTSTSPVMPHLITISNLTTVAPVNEYRLVKIEGAKFSTTETSFSSKQVPMAIGGATFNVRAMPGSDLIGTAIPAANKTFDVVGILIPGMMGKYYIQMRSTADLHEVSIGTAVEQVVEKQTVWTSAGVIKVEVETGCDVRVYDMTGRNVSSVQAQFGVNTISVDKGVYVVIVDDKPFKMVVK